MKYCARCTFPENARPTIVIDEEGICSGCRVSESKKALDWEEREQQLISLLNEYKGSGPYDCIIPVSGGKDSTYQCYLAKKYGMNPLLVTYNHCFNTQLGVRNLNNLVKTFGFDLARVTTGLETARKLSKYMLEKCGDVTWHYHCGIFTVPFQIAVEKKIPLILWGDHARSELTGQFRLEDYPEFVKWCRDQYDMRGITVNSIASDPSSGLSMRELQPFVFPDDDLMESIGVRGVYMGAYVNWDALKITKFIVENCNWKPHQGPRDKTFNLYHKLDDHANGVHDYLKFLKFGYGRATDHTSEEIRHGRMTREQGKELTAKYDHVRPDTLDQYLEFLGISEDQFEGFVDNQRDLSAWEFDGYWKRRNFDETPSDLVERARLPLVGEADRSFGENNNYLYYSDIYKPIHANDTHLADEFMI